MTKNQKLDKRRSMTITLGNFTQVGGRNVAVGGATGLDTESIINALVGAREIPNTALEEQLVTAGTVFVFAYLIFLVFVFVKMKKSLIIFILNQILL